MPDVVQTQQDGAEHLPRNEQVPQIGPTEPSAACLAVASRLKHRLVFSKSGITDLKAALGCKNASTSAVSARQDAVEHVHAGSNSSHKISLVPHAHEVSRPIDWQHGGRHPDRLVERLSGLAHRHAADRVSGQIEGRHLLGRAAAKTFIGTTLHDAEQGLLVRASVRCHASLQPAGRAVDGLDKPLVVIVTDLLIVRRCQFRPLLADTSGRIDRWRAVIECHDDVSPEIVLDLHGPLGREFDLRAIDNRLENNAVIAEQRGVGQRPGLKAARIGEDRAVPLHEGVDTTERGDEFIAGTEHQMPRIVENDL